MSDGVVLMTTRQAPPPSASRHRNAPPPPPPLLVDEVITEILTWLPVKSLLKFRCVCKSWKSLISKPNFVKLHLQRSARNVNVLLMWERVTPDLDNLCLSVVPCSLRSLLENPSYTIAEDQCYRLTEDSDYYVVGSCNGLVCWVDVYQNTFREYWFYLWNPATKLTSKKLAWLHASDYYRLAFGYDNLNDTYKVLAFRFGSKAKEESQKIQVKICSLGDNRWRNIDTFPVIPFDTPHEPGHNDGVYFNGTLNWLASCNNSDDYQWNNTFTIAQLEIVSLDMGTETYKQLLLPRWLDEVPQAEPTIGVLMDCLCFSYDSKRTHFVIWQMKEFGVEKSWTQFMKFSYQVLNIDCLEFPLPLPLLPLCMSENGDVLIMAISINGDSHAILYNRRDNRAKRTELPKYICMNDTKDYIESLVSPFCN